MLTEWIKNTIKRLFCRHEYWKVGSYEDYDGSVRYSVRHYICRNCGKSIWIDGRLDNIAHNL